MRLSQIAKILDAAKIVSPKGEETKEITNFEFEVENPYMNYKVRKLSNQYLAAEMDWYLSADPYNNSIEKYARIWSRIKQLDGQYFSNYGCYWFGKQSGFNWVVDCLKRDRNSRQAVIPMLNKHHLFKENKDVVCTLGIMFLIRDEVLNMYVNMRSSDFILGYAYDLPVFTMLHQMVSSALGCKIGTYYHKSISLHVYKRHFRMLAEIALEPDNLPFDIPKVTDHVDLISRTYKSDLGKWIKKRLI